MMQLFVPKTVKPWKLTLPQPLTAKLKGASSSAVLGDKGYISKTVLGIRSPLTSPLNLILSCSLNITRFIMTMSIETITILCFFSSISAYSCSSDRYLLQNRQNTAILIYIVVWLICEYRRDKINCKQCIFCCSLQYYYRRDKMNCHECRFCCTLPFCTYEGENGGRNIMLT